MKNIVAKFTNELTEEKRTNLNNYARIIENGRVDGVSFYVGSQHVTAHRWHSQLTKQEQVNLLMWFLEGYKYELTELN